MPVVTTGLIYASDFANLSGWTVGADFAVDTLAPCYIAAPRSAIIAVTPTPSSSDAGGAREGHLFIDDNGTWYLFYDAGDGTAGANGPWRVQVESSTDKGLNWTKLGQTNIGLNKTSTPADGAYSGRGVLFVEKRGSTYYMEMLSGDSLIGTQIPGQPYESDVFTTTGASFPLTWIWVRRSSTHSASGYDSADSYMSCHVLDSGTYQGFFGARNAADDTNRVGRATASTPDGPWTKIGSQIPDAIKGAPENPKVWWSAALNKWVMTLNEIHPAGFTDRNSLFFSDSLTDWSACYRRDIQGVFPADGVTAIGQASPLYEVEGVPAIDNGYLGFVFDSNPTDSNHIGRKVYYSVLEPSATALKYTGASLNTARRSLSHDDFETEFACEFESFPGSDHVSFDFRIQGGGDCYRVMVQGGDGLKLQKVVSGTPSNIGTPIGSLNTQVGWLHRVRVRAVGTTIQGWLDGELQVDETDASYASGVSIGFAAGGTADSRIRRFHVRESSDVTIMGVNSGDTVTLRSWSGVPVATTTASGSSVTFSTVTHYPIRGYEINGVYTQVSGGIYGGEVIQVFNPAWAQLSNQVISSCF